MVTRTTVGKGLLRGDAIPNSKYYRTFCSSCGSPMRTMMHKIYSPIYCEECDGHTVSEFVDLRDLHNYPSQEGTSRGERMGGDMRKDEMFEQKIRMKF